MINRFSKMRDSWFTKIILTVTALSFMSLFGVSGYYSAANSNKAVIKVDDIEITQSEFSYLLQRDLARIKAITGKEDEDGELKKTVANLIAQTKLNDAILENTMKKYKVDFSRGLISQILHIMPQFSDNGVFNKQAYQTYLRNANKSEDEMVQDIKRNMAYKVLVETQVAGAKVPEVLQKQMEKVLGQRRTFKYVRVNKADAKITRQPTEDELDQIYDDLSDELMIPEKRDVTLMFLSQADLAAKIEVSPQEVEAYYKEHIDEYEQPEKRAVLQMVFASEEDAQKAAEQLAQGADFAAVAAQNGQKAADIDLGFVAKNDMVEELGEVIFALAPNQVSAPVQLGDGWQLLKVTGVKAAEKVAREVANKEIADLLRQEKAYDGSYEVLTQIEDKLGAGTDLNEVAQEFGAKLYKVKAYDEEGNAESADASLTEVLQNKDVIDAAFSYNEGEVSQAVESDDGVVAVSVDKIYDAHKTPREESTKKLLQIWEDTERDAIVKETVDNIQHDTEAGDDLSESARRYGLRVVNSRPINRGENIDKLTLENMKDLFAAAKDEAVVIESGDDYVVAATSNIYDDSASLTEQNKEQLKQALYGGLVKDMGEALLKDYASKYKVEVQYNRMGLGD